MADEETTTVVENADVEQTPEAAEAENTSTEDVVAETTDEPEAEATEVVEEKPKVDPKQRKIAKQARDNREMKRENARLMKMLETQTENVSRMTKTDTAPKIEDFETMDEYLNARDTFKDSKAEKPAEQETYRDDPREELFDHGSGRYDDFEDIVRSQDARFTVPMLEAIFEIDDLDLQTDVTYYLGNNIKEASRISRLSERRQIAEIAKLEMKVSKAPAKKRASKAPAPIKPVGGAKTTGDGFVDGESYESFLKKRNKQIGR